MCHGVIPLLGLDLDDSVIGVSLARIGAASDRNFRNLAVTIKETGEALAVRYGAGDCNSSLCHVQAIEFVDGTALACAEILKGNGLHGGALDDARYGGAGSDAINCNAGDGALGGGAGYDAFP